MSFSPSPDSPSDHGILAYFRMSEKLAQLQDKTPIPMQVDTTLSNALDAMSCIPFVRCLLPLPYSTPVNECNFTIAGVPAGSLGQPDIDIIVQQSKQSSFGRGSENIMDISYRNGREIPASDIQFKHNPADILKYLTEDVGKTMFPGRQIQLKLYKLAVYEASGHFDWHMDSTHSDKHHATVLVALNTDWEGGDLVLRRNGIETPVHMQPELTEHPDPLLQTVTFYTDTEHRVEPVTRGIRIVLQYDIEVGETQEGEEDEDEDDDERSCWLEAVQSNYSRRMECQGVAQAAADKAAVEKVIAAIKELHSSGVKRVGFALQYLYRRASIRAEYLKGSDAFLYNALLASGAFKVSLYPVVLQEVSDHAFESIDHFAYRFDDDGRGGSESASPSWRRKAVDKFSTFHVPKLSAIKQISSQDYVEHMGNEAMPAEYRYFGGGMFVRSKVKELNPGTTVSQA